MLRKFVSGQFVHIAGVNVSTGAIVSGATWTMRRCLDGTFGAGGATITEDGTTGFYKVALAQADTNGNDIGYFFTATNCVPVTLNVITTAADPTDTVRFGLTALPNAAAEAVGGLFTRGTGAGQINQEANGYISVNLKAILSTVLTETVGGYLAAAFKKLFDVATPTWTADATGGQYLADRLLDRDMSTGTDSGTTTIRTVRQALRALRNKWTNSGGTYTVYKEDDSTTSWSGTLSTDAAAVPVIGNDPAG
jgi:hypothetical protein